MGGSSVTYHFGRAEGLFKSRTDLGCQVVKGTQGRSDAIQSREVDVSQKTIKCNNVDDTCKMDLDAATAWNEGWV